MVITQNINYMVTNVTTCNGHLVLFEFYRREISFLIAQTEFYTPQLAAFFPQFET